MHRPTERELAQEKRHDWAVAIANMILGLLVVAALVVWATSVMTIEMAP